VSDDRSPDEKPAPDSSDADRRRRRARVFGEVLPDRTSDEAPDAAEESSSGSDEWLRRQKPPHHD
jgi:hypothetical protein